jgi:hypothetical protein
MPVNKALNAVSAEQAAPETRRLIERWGALHAVRTLLGASATLIFLSALL